MTREDIYQIAQGDRYNFVTYGDFDQAADFAIEIRNQTVDEMIEFVNKYFYMPDNQKEDFWEQLNSLKIGLSK